jgi:hypothetical protein
VIKYSSMSLMRKFRYLSDVKKGKNCDPGLLGLNSDS